MPDWDRPNRHQESWPGCGVLAWRRWSLYTPLYVGRVTHKGQTYEGRQAPIVSLAIWEKVQERLASKTIAIRQKVVSSGRLLMGLLFDDRGNAMSPNLAGSLLDGLLAR